MGRFSIGWLIGIIAIVSTARAAVPGLPDACAWKSKPDSAPPALWCADSSGKELMVSLIDFNDQTAAKAAAGDSGAMVLMGVLYSTSMPDNLHDGRLAWDWFSKAAAKGEPVATFGQAYLSYRGLGTQQDDAKALQLLEQAANSGVAPAAFWAGRFYANGIGTTKNETKAIDWYRNAADKGDIGAAGMLSLAYTDGRGVPADSAQASQWWKRFEDSHEPKSNTPQSELRFHFSSMPQSPPVAIFVQSCMEAMGGCRVAVSVLSLTAILGGHPRFGCKMPNDGEVETKAVLKWLIEHKEAAELPARNGILAAMTALWPC